MILDYDLHFGTFISRPNRFIAHIDIDGEEVISHVPNTGRLKELLIPGVAVMLSYHSSESRKTKYELRMVKKNDSWISIDSQLPNALAYEAINKGIIKELIGYSHIKREVKYQNSRFDLQLARTSIDQKDTLCIEDDTVGNNDPLDYGHHRDNICFVEVKGVTLEQDGWTRFPDTPTARGRKHIDELIHAAGHGYRAVLLFIIQLDRAKGFSPNHVTDPDFASKIKEAMEAGVDILAYRCAVTPYEVKVTCKIPVELQ